ncbi:hypothetical protein IG631_19743 [Alternaria alternata]|nr:hypothetical protein IG631_19743 [Alternaria alternata]
MVQASLSTSLQNDDKSLQQLNEREPEAESSLKTGDKTDDTLIVHRGAIRVPSPDPSLICFTLTHSSSYPQRQSPSIMDIEQGPRTCSTRSAIRNPDECYHENTRNGRKQGYEDPPVAIAACTDCHRQRISPISDLIRENEYHRGVLLFLHVVQEDRTLPFRNEGSPLVASC